MGFRRRLAVAVIVAAAGVGCVEAEQPIDDVRFVPVVRLADARARAGGWREPATATIGDTSRYVLGRGDAESIAVRTAGSGPRADASGRLDLDVECPPKPPGSHNVVVDLLTFDPGVERAVERVTQRLGGVCGAEGGGWRPVRLEGLRPNKPFLLATASMLRKPPPFVVSPIVEVPGDGQLRVTLGVRADGQPPADPLDVQVMAIAPGGRRYVVGRRTVRARDVAPPGAWTEWRIPLGGVRRSLGAEMRFLFEAESRSGAGGLLHVLWGDPTVWGPPSPEASERGRNVVLISLDTFRADRLGAAGYPLDVTPNLDRFARDGTMFTDAVSTANWTKPAHATMLTGTYPCVHGVDWGGDTMEGPMSGGIVPIAERLRSAGWVTAAFTEDAYVSPDAFQRGFDVFVANHGNARDFANIEGTVAAASAWIAENATRPFFVLVHTYQVHEPYAPPPAQAAFTELAAVPAFPGLPPPSDASMADAAAYLGEVAYTDAVIGRLLQRIDELGLRNDTIVVVTSDHGEAFGEHGRRFHGMGIEREQMRVPLVVRAPGLVAQGRRIDELVGLVDLTPTLLDLLGFDRPPWMQGVSLAAAMRVGTPQPVPSARALPLRGFGKVAGIRGPTWKIRFGNRSHIWDLASDPGELRPKVAAERTVETMKRAAESWCERGRTQVARAERLQGTARRSQVSVEDRLKLHALGYVQ